MKFENQNFKDQTIELDFNDFSKCKFERCTMVFHGYGSMRLDGCTFNDIRWHLNGPASKTAQFMSALYANGEGGKQQVEGLFDEIRKGAQMKWYKYTQAEYAKRMVETGSVRLGALSTYQDIEKLGAAVGDKHENVKVVYTDDKEVKTSPDQLNWLEREKLFRFGPKAKVTNFVSYNNQMDLKVGGENLYAFCVSTEFDRNIMDTMSKENAAVSLAPYDACVEIVDGSGFVNALNRNLQKSGFTCRGYGNCNYEGRRRHWSDSDAIPTWRLKEAIYAYQKECRILFRAPQEYSRESIMIDSSEEIRRYCRLMPL